LVSLLWLVYIVKPLYYYGSVLKSISFTPNSFPQSFLSIPDHCCSSEIRTFRCYEGTAHKLRPSPFGIHLWSPESVILPSEPNKKPKMKLWNGEEYFVTGYGVLRLHHISKTRELGWDWVVFLGVEGNTRKVIVVVLKS
jgi:hypothetical protein